jgi:polysaccharide export outer membrane protein
MRGLSEFERIVAFTILAMAALCFSAAAHADTPDGLRPSETVIVTAPQPSVDTDYKLGPGDKVRVTVYNEDDLSGEFQVDGSGYVRLPLVGQVQAAHLTARILEANVEAAFADGYLLSPRVNIEVTTYRPFYVIGQVNRPGEYPYVSNMSALNAIAVAGGYTEHAIESTLYVRHEGEVEEHAVDPDEQTRIFPGDTVRVRQSVFWSIANILSPIMPLAYALRP